MGLNLGISKNGGFPQQPWVFLLKMIILGCEMGVPPFKETAICLATQCVGVCRDYSKKQPGTDDKSRRVS